MTVLDRDALADGEHWAENAPLAVAFREFDRANPHVYAELVRLARKWHLQRGPANLGMKMLWEVMRWNLAIATASDEPFRLNNNYTSFYARKVMAHHPDLAGMFETRRRDERCECWECRE